jgi:hypothetical protein
LVLQYIARNYLTILHEPSTDSTILVGAAIKACQKRFANLLISSANF